MAALIRLKRPFNAEPSETLILNCKRRKTIADVDNEGQELSTVLKFAGTINKQEEIFTHLKKPTKFELEEQFKKHNINLSAKLRSQKLEESKKSRYKIVNCLRSKSSTLDQSSEDAEQTEYTIFDLETVCLEQDSTNKVDTNYVYDLYYTTSDDLGDAYLEDYVNMYPYNDKLVYGSIRDNGINGPDSEDDSEDSNAENNWRNDYPDESDVESITEEDMLQAMKKCDLDDLSSDDAEEGFVYSVDSESAGFEEDIDDTDVQRYGERYARFKAKHKKQVETQLFNHDLYYGDIDEEEYYY